MKSRVSPAGAMSADLEPGEFEARAVFAIHPGGPKILDHVEKLLSIDPRKNAHSHAVLRERGNMSSATLPHIRERILADRSILPGTPVLSLAFGPGLTICGKVARVDKGRSA